MSLLAVAGAALVTLGDEAPPAPPPRVADAPAIVLVEAQAGAQGPVLTTKPPPKPRPPPPADDDHRRSLLDLDFSLGPWTLHGYFQVDGAAYDQAPPGPPEEDFRRGGVQRSDAASARDLVDGVYLRRARLGGEGSIGDNIAYRVMLELGANNTKGEPTVAEAWVSYNRLGPYVLQAGAFPQPANMEDATSSDSSLFLERATAADLARGLGAGDGRIGITLRRSDPRWMAAVSLTGPQIDRAEDYSPRAAIVGRVSRTVSWAYAISAHLGVNGAYVLTPAKEQQTGAVSGFPVRFKNTPEVDVDGTTLIDTGDIFAKHANVVGLEFAAQRRNLYLQAEAFHFRGERETPPGLGDAHFNGLYVQGSWILTGENRRFDQSRGAFWFPKANKPLGGGGWGAWEVAARYSRMDLNDREGALGEPPPDEGVRGGDQSIWAAALLWYPRPRVRLMLNYLHVAVDRLNPARPLDPQPFGPPPDTPPVGVQIGQSLNIVAARLRYSF